MATRVVAQGRRSCCHGRSAVHEPVSVESRTGLYGTFMAYDNTSLEPLWKINVGAGINAPPMTFEAGGKQYVTVMTGLSRGIQGTDHAEPRASRHARPDHAVCVRAVTVIRRGIDGWRREALLIRGARPQ